MTPPYSISSLQQRLFICTVLRKHHKTFGTGTGILSDVHWSYSYIQTQSDHPNSKKKTVLTFFVPPWVVVINPSSNLSQSCLEKPSEPLLLITLTKAAVGVKSGGYTGAPPCNLLTVCTLKEFEPVLSHNNFHWTSEEKDHKDKSSTTTPGDISVAR